MVVVSVWLVVVAVMVQDQVGGVGGSAVVGCGRMVRRLVVRRRMVMVMGAVWDTVVIPLGSWGVVSWCEFISFSFGVG
jgi:hypothetical protein